MHTTGNLNLIAAWVGIFLGFLVGFGFGVFFHKEKWLGGYTSFKRRLYRLAHIALFALATINFFFYLTVRGMDNSGIIEFASVAFVVGAALMPVCCVAMAHIPPMRYLFAIPVFSLLTAAALTINVVATSSPSIVTHGVHGWAVR